MAKCNICGEDKLLGCKLILEVGSSKIIRDICQECAVRVNIHIHTMIKRYKSYRKFLGKEKI